MIPRVDLPTRMFITGLCLAVMIGALCAALPTC
jgi:hypothetical protein